MRVHRIVLFPQIENDRVSIGLIQWDIGGIFTRRLLRQPIGNRRNDGIRNRNHGLAKDRVALQLLTRARVNAALRIKLLPIDRIALSQPYATVDRQRSACVSDSVATRIRRDVSLAVQWRIDRYHRLAVHRNLAAALRDLLPARRRSTRMDHDAMGEVGWNRRSGCKRNVEK